MDIGIQCEKAVQQFTKQRDITFSGKAVTVQRHLNIHATQQKASFKTLYQAVLNIASRRRRFISLSVQSYSASVPRRISALSIIDKKLEPR